MIQSDIEERFDNSYTQKFGFPKPGAANKVVKELRDSHIEFIKSSPFLVMATSDSSGNCDASPKGGTPGFVKVIDKSKILLPDVAGNKLFQSYQNIDENPHIGIVFFIPGLNETLRVNGKASIVSHDEIEQLIVKAEVHNPDDNSKILQGILMEINEAYGHCPRAFNFSNLWDTQQIDLNNGTMCSLNK
jgi:PPOX class probable FMN-dependent enzyme